MQFLKTLFWVVLAVAGAVFAMRNWTAVPLVLWSGLEVDAKLPVLLLIDFLIGLVPTLVLHRTTRWRLRRRLDSAERALGDIRGPIATPSVTGVAVDTPARS